MNAGILAPGYAPPMMPRALLGNPQPVPTPYGSAGDPYWANVSLLLRNDSRHNGTAFTDASPNARSISIFGDARSSAAASRFQQTSIATGANASASAALTNAVGLPASAIAFGTADFTVEAWYLRTTGFTNHVRFLTPQNPGSSGSNRPTFLVLSTGTQYADVFGAVLGQSAVLTWSNNRWYHLAWCRQGTTLRYFRDGVQTGSFANSTNMQADSSRVNVAPSNDGHFITDLRVTAGVARYTAPFAPLAAPFPTF